MTVVSCAMVHGQEGMQGGARRNLNRNLCMALCKFGTGRNDDGTVQTTFRVVQTLCAYSRRYTGSVQFLYSPVKVFEPRYAF
jgi:hypothetical protein